MSDASGDDVAARWVRETQGGIPADKMEAALVAFRNSPDVPSGIDEVSGYYYVRWVIEVCLSWFDHGQPQAAQILFVYLLRRNPVTNTDQGGQKVDIFAELEDWVTAGGREGFAVIMNTYLSPFI